MKVSPTVSRWLPVMFMAGMLIGMAVPGSSDISPGGTHILRQGPTIFEGSIGDRSVFAGGFKVKGSDGRMAYLQGGCDEYPSLSIANGEQTAFVALGLIHNQPVLSVQNPDGLYRIHLIDLAEHLGLEREPRIESPLNK